MTMGPSRKIVQGESNVISGDYVGLESPSWLYTLWSYITDLATTEAGGGNLPAKGPVKNSRDFIFRISADNLRTMSSIINNLQEHTSWLHANITQAQLAGFSYSLSRSTEAIRLHCNLAYDWIFLLWLSICQTRSADFYLSKQASTYKIFFLITFLGLTFWFIREESHSMVKKYMAETKFAKNSTAYSTDMVVFVIRFILR